LIIYHLSSDISHLLFAARVVIGGFGKSTNEKYQMTNLKSVHPLKLSVS